MIFNLKHDLEPQQLIYLRDEPGSPSMQVMQNDRFRWLQLDGAVQTVMDRKLPWQPVLPYINAMLLALYFVPQASHALELGLGGGAIQRYLARHSRIKLTTVELQDEVIDCCQTLFNPNQLSMDLVQQDAAYYLNQCSKQDILFIDLYSQQACPAFLFTAAFYQHCEQVLNQAGILALNLLSDSEIPMLLVTELLTQCFGQTPLLVRIPGYQNRVLLASKQPISWQPVEPIIVFAEQQQLQLSACQLDL